MKQWFLILLVAFSSTLAFGLSLSRCEDDEMVDHVCPNGKTISIQCGSLPDCSTVTPTPTEGGGTGTTGTGTTSGGGLPGTGVIQPQVLATSFDCEIHQYWVHPSLYGSMAPSYLESLLGCYDKARNMSLWVGKIYKYIEETEIKTGARTPSTLPIVNLTKIREKVCYGLRQKFVFGYSQPMPVSLQVFQSGHTLSNAIYEDIDGNDIFGVMLDRFGNAVLGNASVNDILCPNLVYSSGSSTPAVGASTPPVLGYDDEY